MKNKAVEAMIRVQFNIPDDVEVTVMCPCFDGNKYAFVVRWIDNYEPCVCRFRLPHIEKSDKIFIRGMDGY